MGCSAYLSLIFPSGEVQDLDEYVSLLADMLTSQAPKVVVAEETLIGMEQTVLRKNLERAQDEVRQDLAALGVDDDGERDEYGRSKQFYAQARQSPCRGAHWPGRQTEVRFQHSSW